MANILLVDDDTESVSGNVAALTSIGHTVAAVSTAAQATELVAQEVPDLVVMEGMLDGGYAGLDLARSLAKDFPTLPLIMLTRADEHFTARERRQQDRDGWLPVARYLEKPVSKEVLLYEVDHLLPGEHR
jgi:CheY-like chemotaxis protein